MTNHAMQRMHERQIDSRLVELCLKYGKRVRTNYGRYLLKQEYIPHVEMVDASAALKAHVEKQLPICCVFDENDGCITVFRVKGRINKPC